MPDAGLLHMNYFTVFNYEDTDVQELNLKHEKYFAKGLLCVSFQAEICPKTQAPHLQGMCFWRDPIQKSTIQRRMKLASGNTCFVDGCGPKKPPTVYILYTQKDDTFDTVANIRFCHGALPLDADSKHFRHCRKTDDPRPGKRTDVSERHLLMLEQAESGNGYLGLVRKCMGRGKDNLAAYKAAERPGTQALLQLMTSLAHERPDEDALVELWWFWGPTGVGKTFKAYELAREFITPARPRLSQHYYEIREANGSNQWFDHSEAKEVFIFDEFNGSRCKFKTLIGMANAVTGRTLPIKGSTVIATYHKLVITASAPPDKIFAKYLSEHQEDGGIDQLFRRLDSSNDERNPRVIAEKPDRLIRVEHWDDDPVPVTRKRPHEEAGCSTDNPFPDQFPPNF